MVHRATPPVPTHTRSSLTRPTTTTTSSLIQLLRSPLLLPESKRTSCLASVCSSISTRTLHCTRLRITRNMNSELTTSTTACRIQPQKALTARIRMAQPELTAWISYVLRFHIHSCVGCVVPRTREVLPRTTKAQPEWPRHVGCRASRHIAHHSHRLRCSLACVLQARPL